ncbi:MAG: 3-oxoacyl-ACP reductase family protein [Methylobacteriaceae bacterium]|jgi:3-oxoacyl-[acyl-carrier protein] reductase|uniref:3-oxoacyl-ACP reductase FabG n=1 Tax=Methylorubrum extorquens TaxID=408 RepID=A0AAX3WBU0_METEX|nr:MULTISPECIES: 3-oxoacyl-ACP reductase family protein [Methylobacteriaceae]KQO86174.1 oxidoreductase [Methylobacterium sp. Leaf92]KQO91705.1 oxidoreductase [Methylobacterium sp. Leaf90]KQQ21623.1 oxidoreductase [Methylobacterium sp. Leaf122]MCG5247074.1 3-oxoacyl-ACP reductase FabG [Methylorubrum extorquens]UYW24690.1 3-oxoacyl-ACP reductase FabG [Methylorubrum extorquens]
MSELAGKRALVTGASRGIGAAIALALAERGADVAITYERSAERAADVVRAIEGQGRRGLAIQADSADAAAVKRSVETAAAELGGLDILVNNAGIARGGPVTEMSLADIDALLAVNIRSVVLASQAAIPHLGEGGRIISIGSCLGERVPFPGVTVYSMTKSALLSFTRGLARELGPQGITVNLVQPGSTDTDMNPSNGEQSDLQRAMTALGHYGRPEDIAAAVAFLASPAARQITGTTLTVDGGANA